MHTRHFPSLPQIGLPESHYANLAKRADLAGDPFAREAAKVGQYITLAMDPNLDWLSKRRYFEHALRRHCNPPPLPSPDVLHFYKSLGDLVRKYAGQEALRLASHEDDNYAFLLKTGVPRQVVAAKSQSFFCAVMGMDRKPIWFNDEDWDQLRIIRSQWI